MHLAAYRSEVELRRRTMYIIEIFFLIDFVIHFFLSYPSPKSALYKPVKDLSLIFQRYLWGNMLEYLIPLIPLQLLILPKDRQKLFYLLKLIRIRRGLSNFKIGSFMQVLKKR
jgi:hypothetical protein